MKKRKTTHDMISIIAEYLRPATTRPSPIWPAQSPEKKALDHRCMGEQPFVRREIDASHELAARCRHLCCCARGSHGTQKGTHENRDNKHKNCPRDYHDDHVDQHVVP